MKNPSISNSATNPLPPLNKIIKVPWEKARAIRGSFLVRATYQYCKPKSEGGLLLPEDNQVDAVDKKFDIGEVVHAGPECEEIKRGDIVIFQRAAAMRIPNGTEPTVLWVLTETPVAIACVLPPLPPEDQLAVLAEFEEHDRQSKLAAVPPVAGQAKPEPVADKKVFTKKY